MSRGQAPRGMAPATTSTRSVVVLNGVLRRRSPIRCTTRPAHSADWVRWGLARRLAPPLHDPRCDPRRPPLLAVVLQDAPQLTLRFAVEQVGGGPWFAAIQAYVQRVLPLEAETPLTVIELHRGTTEVEDEA